MELFKMIIIDDEMMIAESLAKLVDYSKYSFEICGCFKNGETALKYIRENHVDAVITDVKMDDLSGIDLLKILNTEFSDIEVILISAYRDFEYAKLAITYKAFEYLTKPISYKEYTDTLIRLGQTLDRRSEVNDTFGNKKMKINGVNKIICDYFNDIIDENSFIDNMLEKNFSKDMIKSYCSMYELELEESDSYVNGEWIYGKDRLLNAIKQIIPFSVHNCFIFPIYSEGDIMRLVIIAMERETEKEDVEKAIKHIENDIYNILTMKFDFKAINNASSIISLKCVVEKSIEYLASTLISYITSNQYDEARRVGNKVFKTLTLAEQQELCVYLGKIVNKYGNGNESFIPVKKEYINNISNSHTLYIYFNEIIDVFCDEKHTDLSEKIIFDVIRYISDNYSKDITLSSTASHAMMNYSYFSIFFKKYVGDTFSNYLSKVRMESAVEFFNKNPEMSIQTVCDSIGYKSLPYFYKEFRKYTGYSPGEYKEKLKNE